VRNLLATDLDENEVERELAIGLVDR